MLYMGSLLKASNNYFIENKVNATIVYEVERLKP